MRIMITGGGTGGHTSPAVAIIEELRLRDPMLAIQWVGRKGGIEERVCEAYAIPFRPIPTRGWPRKNPLKRAVVGCIVALGFLRAFFYIKKFRPQVVMGVGGYVSVPLTWMAQRLGVPTVLHEQNKQLGMANRVLAVRADRLLLSYPDTLGDYPESKACLVGNPVRSGFTNPIKRAAACEKLDLDPSIPVVLVCGGSQGAHTLNEAMSGTIEQFRPDEIQFIWMTGNADVVAARAVASKAEVRVDVHPFIDDMATACAAATLIVSRAGASSTAELAALGRPSILVPYPHATDDHQAENARAFEKAGASVILEDEACSSERLTGLIRDLIGDAGRLHSMAEAAAAQARPVAVETIVEEVFSLVMEEAH